jgi:ABC-2 type transport system permease protein
VDVIAAILRAQFLAMRRVFGTGAAMSLVGGACWYGLWTAAGWAAFVYTASAPLEAIHGVLAIALAGIFLYWQVMPVVSASMGSSLDLRKLLAYPIPHARLFFVEVLLRLASGLDAVLVLIGGGAGLAVNPAIRGAPAVVGAMAVFVLFNLLLASGVRSLLERLLTRRKIRELMVVLMAALWMVPRFFMQTGFHPKVFDRALGAAQAVGFPWSATANAALGQFRLASWLSLAVWTLVAGWFGRAQFERSLRHDAAAAQAVVRESARRASLADGFYRLPSRLLPDPLAAIVEKELRSLARTPRFRTLFVMGFTFGLLVWLPMVIGRPGGAHDGSFLSQHFLTIVSAYALTLLGQVTYWNCFAFDRSAAAFWFVAPQPIAAVLVGKNIASQAPVYLEIAILTAISLALRLVAGWGAVVEAFAVVGICSIYMLAMGNVTSIEYPRGLNPERVSQGGASGRFQTLILIFYPLAVAPVALAYLARFAFDSELAFRLVLALAAVVGGIVYKVALDSAVATAARRREAILQTLSAGDGPVVS